jgi:FSR family fosmidomycin resistance protein-like MFS transporter
METTDTILDTAPVQPSAANRNLVLVSAAHAVIHATAVLMPLIYPIIQRLYHLSYTEIGLVIAISNFVGGFLQFGFGLLSKYIMRKVMLGIGNILVGISVALTSTITGFGTLMGWSVLNRIAGAPQHPVGAGLLSHVFTQKRRGFALAAHVAGGNIGTLLVPLVATPIITSWGWRPTLLLFGLPGVVVGALLLLLVDEGQEAQQERSSSATPPVTWHWRELLVPLRDYTIVLIMLASIAAAGGRGIGILTTYIPLYLANQLHMTPVYVSAMFTLLLIGSVAGPLIAGRLSDRLGRKVTLLIVYPLAALLTITFALLANSAVAAYAIPASLFAMGLTAYAESPLLQAYLADQAQEHLRDITFGLYFALAFGVGSLWGGVIGWVIDHVGFTGAFAVMACSYILAATILLPSRMRRA